MKKIKNEKQNLVGSCEPVAAIDESLMGNLSKHYYECSKNGDKEPSPVSRMSHDSALKPVKQGLALSGETTLPFQTVPCLWLVTERTPYFIEE